MATRVVATQSPRADSAASLLPPTGGASTGAGASSLAAPLPAAVDAPSSGPSTLQEPEADAEKARLEAAAALKAAVALEWTFVKEGSEFLKKLQESSETVAFIKEISQSKPYEHFKYVPGASHNSFERFCFGDDPDHHYKGGDKNTGCK